MKKIIEIDTDLVKIAPLEVSAKISAAGHRHYQQSMADHGDVTATGMFKAMLAEVPVSLPGVVEHSGEPCGYMAIDGGLRYFTHSLDIAKQWPEGSTQPVFTYPPALPDQDGFEAWSKREGAMNLKPAHTMYCEDGRFPATYFYAHTETAWRAWANKPQPEIAALQARIAELEDQVRRKEYAIKCKSTLLADEQSSVIDAKLTITELEAQLAAQLAAQTEQEPTLCQYSAEKHGGFSWFDCNGGTAEFYESQGCKTRKLYAAPPAPANALAIVQAALEAAAKYCDSKQEFGYSPEDLAEAIRAINPQTIIDAAINGTTKPE